MRRIWLSGILLAVLLSTGFAGQTAAVQSQSAESGIIAVPFDLVLRHILIKTTISNSGPLWFIFDTGDKVAIVDLDRAKSLGLDLHGEVNVGGAGAGTLKGAFVR